MDKVLSIVHYVQTNWVAISSAIASVIGFASIIVKLTPTIKDDNFLLPIVKFIGNYIALNNSVSDADRPK